MREFGWNWWSVQFPQLSGRFSVPGSLVNDLAYKVLLLSGITGALLKSQSVDQGRRILCDFAVPAYRWVTRGILRVFAGLGPEVHFAAKSGSAAGEPAQPPRVFCIRICAITYSTLLLFIVFSCVTNVFVSKLGDWGYVVTAVHPLFASAEESQAGDSARARLVVEDAGGIHALENDRKAALAAAAVAVILFVPPFASRVSSEFILEPASATNVHAAVSGQVRAS